MEANIGKHFFSKEYKFSDSQILRFSDFKRPLIMGILNLTPDSFYDGGSHNSTDDVLRSPPALQAKISAGATALQRMSALRGRIPLLTTKTL